jgi:hypothetical protein
MIITLQKAPANTNGAKLGQYASSNPMKLRFCFLVILLLKILQWI